jgi:hypothetical protein
VVEDQDEESDDANPVEEEQPGGLIGIVHGGDPYRLMTEASLRPGLGAGERNGASRAGDGANRTA